MKGYDEAAGAGLCVWCDAAGPPGEPCASPSCHRRGHHHLPSDRAARWLGDEAPPDVVIGQRWGDYLVVDRLGAGGMGAVYLALQWPLGLPAALKILTATSPALVERFQGEAAALARLTHPNVVRVYGTGVQNGRPYLAMEFIEGGRTLADAQREGLPPDAIRSILRQLLNALESAHERGVVHRDLKPQNVMIQSVAGEPWHVKLVDFGVAKFLDDGHSTRLLAGTPAYMAPEQITGRDIGPWTDLYALAVIAYELWTGRRPFGGRTTEEVIRRKTEPGDPTEGLTDGEMPAALRALLRAALALDPRERPRSAGAFRERLDTLPLGSGPGLAPAADEASAAAAAMRSRRVPSAAARGGERSTPAEREGDAPGAESAADGGATSPRRDGGEANGRGGAAAFGRERGGAAAFGRERGDAAAVGRERGDAAAVRRERGDGEANERGDAAAFGRERGDAAAVGRERGDAAASAREDEARVTSAELRAEAVATPPARGRPLLLFGGLAVLGAAGAWWMLRTPAPAPAADLPLEPARVVVDVTSPAVANAPEAPAPEGAGSALGEPVPPPSEAAPARPTAPPGEAAPARLAAASREAAPPGKSAPPGPAALAMSARAPAPRRPASAPVPPPAPAPAAPAPASDASPQTLGELRTALAQCRCARARRLLDALGAHPERARLAERVSACREPLVGERCVEGDIR